MTSAAEPLSDADLWLSTPLVLRRIQMLRGRVALLPLPMGLQPTDLFRGEGRDPFLPWASAFAGVTET